MLWRRTIGTWPKLNERLGDRVLVLGDDLLCTNPERIRRAIECRAANALLLKVNQIGTLTEAVQAMQLARSARWRITASARSGETEDNWLADLASAGMLNKSKWARSPNPSVSPNTTDCSPSKPTLPPSLPNPFSKRESRR